MKKDSMIQNKDIENLETIVLEADETAAMLKNYEDLKNKKTVIKKFIKDIYENCTNKCITLHQFSSMVFRCKERQDNNL